MRLTINDATVYTILKIVATTRENLGALKFGASKNILARFQNYHTISNLARPALELIRNFWLFVRALSKSA